MTGQIPLDEMVWLLQRENDRLTSELSRRFVQLEKAEKELHALRTRTKHDRP